jgi:hypothetical protein
VRRTLVVLPLLALAGCGVQTVPAVDVADDVATLLEKEVGVRPDVACPDELPVEVGASTRCTLTAGDDPTEYGVTVTVESVEDDEPEYGVEVDREPLD